MRDYDMNGRSVVLIASAVFGFGTVDTAAWAAPVGHPVPEAATNDGSVAVIDDPTIERSRPLRVDTWSPSGPEDALSVQFSLASPDCSGVHAVASETADTVTVDLRVGTHPDAVHRMCTMIVVPATLEVPLQAPLGARTVLSAS
jgi:hypothetical protein